MLAGMNWRAGLTIVLLLAAIACGLSVWTLFLCCFVFAIGRGWDGVLTRWVL